MAYSKAQLFQVNDYYFSILSSAFAHPARIEILRRLIDGNKLPVRLLNRDLPLDNSTISQHIKMLRDLKLIAFEQKGKEINYFMNPDYPPTLKVVKVLLHVNRQIFHSLTLEDINRMCDERRHEFVS